MQITILNKGTYEVDDGYVLNFTKYEKLDSGTLVISNQETKINAEPFDIVQIGDHYFCLDTITEIMLCPYPKLYRYEITLCSETKQLENIVLPNLKITNIPGEDRTIWNYLSQYVSEYCPKIKVTSGGLVSKFWFADGVEARFAQIKCPEMQWNQPTLREVLNDLMMIDDCLVVIKKGKISFMDLTEVGDDVSNDSNINYVSRSRSAEDYISELQCNLINVTNSGDVVTKVEYVGFSIPDSEAIMTTENVVLKTKYPIYRLKKVEIMFPHYFKQTDGGEGIIEEFGKWFSFDLMDFSLIYEEKEWITKNVTYGLLTAGPENINDWKKYQDWTLYYQRNNNEIVGWNKSKKFLWTTYIYWETLLKKLLTTINPDYVTIELPYFTFKLAKWYNILFKVEYETLEGCLFRASKNKNVSHQRVIIDNQSSSYVDSSAQGFLEYQKANRLGNEQLQINARYNVGETPIKIGDIYQNCIIYQCQYQHFAKHTEVNALATENYILRDYFTGVKSKIRSWKIADGSDALDRHDLIKRYLEFSWNSTSDIDSSYFLSSFAYYSASPIKCCYVRTKSGLYDIFPPNDAGVKSYYLLDCVNRIVGNSFVLSFRFNDNYWAGQSLHTEKDTLSVDDKYIKYTDIKLTGNNFEIVNAALRSGGVPMYQHRYTDENGEFKSIGIIFADGIKLIPTNVGEDIKPEDSYLNLQEESKSLLWHVYQRPRAYEFNIRGDGYNYGRINLEDLPPLHKDSQEITHMSAQFEFCTETNNICFSRHLIAMQQAVNQVNHFPDFSIKVYNDEHYNFRRPDKLPDATPLDEIGINIDIQGSQLNIDFQKNFASLQEAQMWMNLQRLYAFYLMSDNNVLLALRGLPLGNIFVIQSGANYRPGFKLYLNYLTIRDKNTYDNTNHYLKT